MKACRYQPLANSRIAPFIPHFWYRSYASAARLLTFSSVLSQHPAIERRIQDVGFRRHQAVRPKQRVRSRAPKGFLLRVYSSVM